MWLGLEQKKLCTGTSANKCLVQRTYAWYGEVIVLPPRMRQVVRDKTDIQESRRPSWGPQKWSRRVEDETRDEATRAWTDGDGRFREEESKFCDRPSLRPPGQETARP